MLAAQFLAFFLARSALAQAPSAAELTRTDITTPVTTGPIATLVSSLVAASNNSVVPSAPSQTGGLRGANQGSPFALSDTASSAATDTERFSVAALTFAPPSSSKPTPSATVSPTFSYYQPPIPRVTARTPPQAFALNSLVQRPRVQRLTLRLSYSAGSPDGFLRRMSTINGQFPGPLIQATVGDFMEITVINDLDMPQSLHWHGIRQEGTGCYDGPPGISQCPILPGRQFTYRFKITSYGTYWYHSHYGNTLADGLYGALIVYSPEDPIRRWRDFDEEQVMFVSDWNNDQSATIVHGLRNLTAGYRGQPFATMPDAVLINGVGQTNCSKAQAGVRCGRTRPASIRGRIGSRLRLRLINPGSEALIRFSVDQHVLKLVEVDDTPVRPVYMHEVSLAPGQRVSVILHLNQGGMRDSFWIRARAAAGCIFQGFELETRAVLRYSDWRGWTWSRAAPTSAPWPDRAPTLARCLDIDHEFDVHPLHNEYLGPVASAGRLDSQAGRFVDPETGAAYLGFGVGADGANRTTYTNYINDPVLKQVQDGRLLNKGHFAHLTFDGPGTGSADILLNQMDQGLSHPFHLHGRPFTIMARGNGVKKLEDIDSIQLNSNPLRRDTILMPNNTWALLRFPMDDPGVWPIHCHLGWHLANGKLGIVVVRPEVVKTFHQPREWLDLCAGTDPNEIGPAKRGLGSAVDGSAANVDNSAAGPSAAGPAAASAEAANNVPVTADFETPIDSGYSAAAASAYNHIPDDPAAAWAAPPIVGNVTVGAGTTPLDSAQKQGLVGNGVGVPGTSTNSSAVSASWPANPPSDTSSTASTPASTGTVETPPSPSETWVSSSSPSSINSWIDEPSTTLSQSPTTPSPTGQSWPGKRPQGGSWSGPPYGNGNGHRGPHRNNWQYGHGW